MRTFKKLYVEVKTDDYETHSVGQEVDNEGQIVVYTNLFQWRDGSIRDEPDPNWDGPSD